jgi:hypothetical protein
MVHLSNINPIGKIKMSVPGYIQKTLKRKPEVTKIFEDLDAWLDHCRINLLPYNPADLYRSKEYKDFQRQQEYLERKARRAAEGKPEPVKQYKPRFNNERFSN